jgi:hypothetical protein
VTKESGVTLGLGGGFYDADKLRDATDEAMKSDNPQEAVDAAVAKVDSGNHRDSDPRAIEGYAFHKRTKAGITEVIQVPNHEIEDANEATASAKTPTKSAAAGTTKE